MSAAGGLHRRGDSFSTPVSRQWLDRVAEMHGSRHQFGYFCDPRDQHTVETVRGHYTPLSPAYRPRPVYFNEMPGGQFTINLSGARSLAGRPLAPRWRRPADVNQMFGK
jgi:hypothetical protein